MRGKRDERERGRGKAEHSARETAGGHSPNDDLAELKFGRARISSSSSSPNHHHPHFIDTDFITSRVTQQ